MGRSLRRSHSILAQLRSACTDSSSGRASGPPPTPRLAQRAAWRASPPSSRSSPTTYVAAGTPEAEPERTPKPPGPPERTLRWPHRTPRSRARTNTASPSPHPASRRRRALAASCVLPRSVRARAWRCTTGRLRGPYRNRESALLPCSPHRVIASGSVFRVSVHRAPNDFLFVG